MNIVLSVIFGVMMIVFFWHLILFLFRHTHRTGLEFSNRLKRKINDG